ncbi:hypothetical protein QSV37_13205 [Acinetobacter sp. VNK23]|uniref:hypothetical protein n=1 Tax=Acinetobacter thutiue TaxID=2998078 RepID=UPI002578318F|nr:hypothetical protein [Acinetobacter thutiue]MDM1021252.1 hypothetical protein [Acinetobacter thutiue]
MCQVLLISTDKWINLGRFNCEDISFTQQLPDYVPEINEMKFNNRWYIAGFPNENSCSCYFRIRPFAMGFTPPQLWFYEDEQSIKATHIAYDIFNQLVKLQISFEIIVSWTQGSINEDINTIHDINLNFKDIDQEQFVFIENSRMLYASQG